MQIDRRALYNALKELVRVADHRSSNPILRNVLLSADGKTLTMTATNLTSQLYCELPAEGKEICVCLPAKLIERVVKPVGKCDGENVVIEAMGDSVTMFMDGITTKVPATDPALFPTMFNKDQQWSLVGVCESKPLREAIEWVLPATSTDIARKHLNSVFIDNQTVVATDGHRLHLAQSPIAPETPMLLPSNAAAILNHILKFDDHATLTRLTTDEHDLLRVRCGKFELTTKLMDEKFPPWKQVVPERAAQVSLIIFETTVLKKALSQVMRLTEQRSLKVCINGSVALSTWGDCLGEAEVIVTTVENRHIGDDLELGLDGRYLADGIPRGNGMVEISFGKQLDPVRLDLPEQRLAVIMPLRL